MEINNKNIIMNLKPDEEVVYVATKCKGQFYSFLVLLFGLTLSLARFAVDSIIEKEYLIYPFHTIVLVFAICVFLAFEYVLIRDYFFTELVLTDKRMMFARFNKLNFINNDQVQNIYGYHNWFSWTCVGTSSDKSYKFNFIDNSDLWLQFRQISKFCCAKKTNNNKRLLIFYIFVCIILSFCLNILNSRSFLSAIVHKVYSYKISQKQTQSQNSNSDYFTTYMNNLQKSIKSNWFPPKSLQNKRVVVMFRVAKDGKLLNAKILNSSNDKATDAAAILALKKTAPFEPLQKQYKGKNIDIQFTFDYKRDN